MVFGYETGTVNVIVPDDVRFSSTLIFFTELIIVFSALFIVSLLGMALIQQLLNLTFFKQEFEKELAKQQRELLLLPINDDNTAGTTNIFSSTINKTRNTTIWSFLCFLSSLCTLTFYLLIYTNVILPSATFSCTNILQITNVLLILSRYTLYFYWNEHLLYSTAVYFAHYVINNDFLKEQYPALKPIKSLTTHKKRMRQLQHSLDQQIHARYSGGEQYLYYKIFWKHYIYRFLLTLWIMIYLIGLLIYTKGDTYLLTVDSNQQDEDGVACKEIFDTESMAMFFYTFGVCGDIATILYLMDEFILSFSNNLVTILQDEESFRRNVFILVTIKKNVTLALISLGCTLWFRFLSFATGLEATLYPLGYTVNMLMVFLVFRFNGNTYGRCCGNRTERMCFILAFNVSKCCCRYKYSTDAMERDAINTTMINDKLKEIQDAKTKDIELAVNDLFVD